MSFSIYVFLLVTVAVATVHPQIFNQCRGQTRVTCTPNVVFQKVINGTVTLTQCTNRLIREDEAKHCSECCQDFGKEMRAVSSDQTSGALTPGGICICCLTVCV